MARVSDYLDKAKADTGLENFGDPGFREGLERLIDSVEREARINDMGRAMFHGQTVMLLTRRLELEDWYARHPEIDEEEIVAPLLVLGLPRTGSTALHALLGEDPAVRTMRNWEASAPCPPPEAATYETDPRIAQAKEQMAMRDLITPRMKLMLPSTATSPSEDQLTMGFNFVSQIFQASFHIPSYAHWLHFEADLEPTFRYVKRVLKLLQWRCPPKRWRLKNPTYSMFVTALDKVFPDARYCMTHRDVANVIPSVADIYFELGKVSTDHFDKHWAGSINVEFCHLGMRRMIAFREDGNEHRFFDIHFAPFQKDPFPTMQRLYDFLGEEFSEEARARMEIWRTESPRGQFGKHEYDPADFGLDPAALREEFRYYTDRFNVPLGKD